MPNKTQKLSRLRPGAAVFRSLFVAGVGLAIFLSGCGGGGGGSSSASPGPSAGPSSNILSGTVLDGYIEGAKVCLDLNGNGACDTAEPSATSDASGKFSLDIGSAGTTGINLIAEVPDTAKDTDDSGMTLAAAGKSAYTMGAPAAPSAVITPLTTLILGRVSTESVSIELARQRVLAEQGLPADTNPNDDYIAKGNSLVHGVVKQMAAHLQQVQNSLPAGTKPEARLAEIFKQLQTAQVDAGKLMPGTDNALNMPASLSNVSAGTLISYRMTSVKGKPITATAMVFTPKSAMPVGGWPLVVFGHGTVGVAQNCAPSVTMKATGVWSYADLGALLISQGYVVVAPDYEGMGPAAMGVEAGHPYLDLGSAGRSMALAAVATKKLMTTQLSGKWATLGHSQGGHAALAGAQFAPLAAKQEPSLSYKGAVAIAPGSNLLASLNTMWDGIRKDSADPANFARGYAAVGVSNGYAAYMVKGAQLINTLVSPNAVFGSNMLDVYNKSAGTQCLDDFTATVTQSVTDYAGTAGATPAKYPGIINAVVNTPTIAQLLAGNEPGQTLLAGKTLVVQGEKDDTVLPAITNQLLSTMKAKGSDVTLSLQTGASATHSGVLYMPTAQNVMAQHLAALLK
jgi:pimeloyl-ACP methyl ester carboxylesterase